MPSDVAYKPVEKFKEIYAGGTLTPPKFMPSFFDWLYSKGLHIVRSRQTTGSLYTIPNDYTFFITSVWGSIVADGGSNSTGTLTMVSDDNLNVLMAVKLRNSATTGGLSDCMSITYAFPVISKSGDIDILLSGTGFLCYAGLTGFLVKNSDIPSF